MKFWLKNLSYLAVLGFPLSVLGTRLGLFDFRVGFTGLRYTLYLALAVLLVSLIVAFVQRNKDADTSRAAKIAALLCLIPILGLGSQIMTAKSVPPIHNIATDTNNPPVFVNVIGLRSAKDNPLDYNWSELAAVQQKAYPEVKTLFTSMDVPAAHAKALSVAKELTWEIVNDDIDVGIIEATHTSLIWGFKDDIVIRIQAGDNQTAIDLHSVSRVGQSDLGANAARIVKFIKAFGG